MPLFPNFRRKKLGIWGLENFVSPQEEKKMIRARMNTDSSQEEKLE